MHAYGGGGFLFVNYRETSTFSEPEDDSSESFNGYLVFGGVDVTVWKLIYAGAEVQFRMVPDALGEGGASREFNETDLGGFVVRMLFGVRK
jgi:opacity protein-like surface antigen